MITNERDLDTRDLRILAENFALSAASQEKAARRQTAFLRDLADLLLPLIQADPETGRQTYLTWIEKTPLSLTDKLTLCEKLVSAGEALSHLTEFWNDAEGSDATASKLSYVDNPYAREAMQHFHRSLGGDSVALCEEASSFSELCESIYNGSSRFGILPIETSSQGKLFAFYSLIDNYELKILSTYRVLHDNEESTTFALASKYISLPASNALDGACFEFSASPEDNRMLSDILQAATRYELNIQSITSLPHRYLERSFVYYLTLQIKSRTFPAFLLFLFLEFPSYTPIGVFHHL